MARAKQSRLQLPTLDTGPVPLTLIRDQARKALLDLIDSRRGRKALILDQAVSGPISLLDPGLSELLTEHGVVKLHYLEPKSIEDASYNQGDTKLAEVRSIIYIVRATVENAQMIAAQVRSRPKDQVHDFAVFFVPRRTIACERILEEEGVYGDLFVGEFALDLVPLEDDVLSLELDSAFKDCVADGDSTALFYTARAIMKLQAVFGLIPRLQGKGPAALAVRDMCIRMRRENPGITAGAGASRIHRAIFIDREVDMVTPMMTQITFEGLIDEITGIKYGAVPWTPKDRKGGEGGASGSDATRAAAAAAAAARGSTLLNSTDPFYREFRDLPFHAAIERLQHHARDAQREYSKLGSKELSELKGFVKGLPKLMMLDRLSDIALPVAEQVKQQLFHDRLKHEQDLVDDYEMDASVAFMEELMYRGSDLLEVLRLMVLLNETHSGVPKRQLDALRSEVLHSYGHRHLVTLNTLERAGFLRQAAPGRSPFTLVRKAFRLSVPEPTAPTTGSSQGGGGDAGGTSGSGAAADISHLYKGYAPLSIRLVEQALLKGGWDGVAEALAVLPGPQYDIVQTVGPSGLPAEKPYRPGSAATGGSGAGASGSAASGGVWDGAPGLSRSASGAGLASRAQSEAGGAGGASGGMQAPPGSGSGAPGGGAAGQGEVVLVVFLGGVTYAEISALRYLSTRPDCPHKFLVLTTKVVNGRTLLQSFIDPAVTRAASAVGLQVA